MPTRRRRYTITSDDGVELALRRSRRRFAPGTSDSKILAALVGRGDRALQEESGTAAERERQRQEAATRLAERFRAPDGLDYVALAESSERWSHP